jgi:hypothetical protein
VRFFVPCLRIYFAIEFLSSVLCSEGASEISQPHCGWTRARKSSRPERTPENPGHFPSCHPAQIYLSTAISHFVTLRLGGFAPLR